MRRYLSVVFFNVIEILRFEEEDDIYLVKVFFAYSQKLDS